MTQSNPHLLHPRWTVLGAGTAAPHPTRSPSGHLLSFPSTTHPHTTRHILIDLGPGTLWRLARAGVSWHDLDAIFITHAHLDHTLDLQSLMFASNLPTHPRTLDLPIHFGPGMLKFVDRLRTALQHWFTPKRYNVLWNEHPTNTTLHLPHGLTAHIAPVQHHPTSIGLRFEHGTTSIAYSGDSALCPSLTHLCTHASLAVVECSSLPQNPSPGHMTPHDIATLIHTAQPQHAALVHRYPELDTFDFDAWRTTLNTQSTLHIPSDGWSWTPQPTTQAQDPTP